MQMARGTAAHRVGSEDFPSPGRTEALYARIVGEIRDSGLSTADIARIVGVAERQVRNWTSGGNTPSGRNRDRLLELHYVTQALRDLYTREGSEIWLHGRKRSLAGRRPVDMLAEGSYEEVLDAVEHLHAGAM
jgi:transcriptional regulator with XRE-family HTH domain